MVISNGVKLNIFLYLNDLVIAVRLLFPHVSSFNIIKTLTLLVYDGSFWCFYNPSNCDMDYRIFIMNM